MKGISKYHYKNLSGPKKNQYLKTTGIKLSGWMPSVPWWYIIKRFKTNLLKWQNDNRQGNQ